MGTSSPSTVTQPFNQSGSQQIQQEQAQTGSLATTGQTAQTSQYTANPFTTEQAQRLANASAGVQGLWGAGVPGMQIAGFTPEQAQALGNIYGTGTNLGGMAGFGAGNSIVGAGLAGMSGMPMSGQDVAQFYNPMAQNVTAQLQNIFGQQNSQATADATKTAGGVGASRIGVAQGNIANQQALAAGQTYAGLYQNALQAAQQQKQQQLQSGMGLAQQGQQNIQTGMGGLQAAYGAGSQVQQLEQARLQALYQQQQQQFNLPFQIQQAQIAPLQGMGVLGGTTTATGQQAGAQTGAQFGTLSGTQNSALTGQQSTQYPAPSLLSQITGGALAGLGGLSLLGGSGGALGGISAIGSLFGASDKRAKTDIQRYGSDPQTGDNLYAFRYKGDPKTYPKVIGPMAQDIQKTHPEDVTQLAARGGIIPSGLGRQPVGRFPARMGPEMNFMPRVGTKIPRKESGGSVLPYTQMTSLFSGTPQFHQMQGPGAPQKSELDSITGDIQKYLKLKTLVSGKKPEPFARVPNEPGPTEGGRFEGSQQQDQGGGQQDSYQGPEAPSQSDYGGGGYGLGGVYRKGGPVGYQDSGVVEPAGLPEYQDQEQPEVEQAGPPDLGPTTVEPADEAAGSATEPVPLPAPKPRIAEESAPAGMGGLGGRGRGYGQGRGGMGGLAGAGNPVGMSLLSAGLGMLAASGQRDARGLPMNFAGALGQGGLQGLRTYSDQQAAAELSRARQVKMGQEFLMNAIRMRNLDLQQRRLELMGGTPTAPAASGAPMTTGLSEAEIQEKGTVVANNEIVQSGPFDYTKGKSPPTIEKGSDVPVPVSVGRYSSETVAQAATMWLETGKLPAIGSARGPELKEILDYKSAIMNYGNALAASRGLSKEDVTEMQRTAPGMLRFILGVDGRSTVALGTAVRHLETMKELRKTWDEGQRTGNLTAWNRLSAEVGRQFGNANVTNIDNAQKIIGPEIIKALGVAGAGTHEDRLAAATGFSPGASTAQYTGAVDTVQKLLGGQLEGRRRQAGEAGVNLERFKRLIGDLPYERLTSQEYKPKGMTGAAAGAPALSGVDQQALDWANANPNDPRAAKIKQRLGIQ